MIRQSPAAAGMVEVVTVEGSMAVAVVVEVFMVVVAAVDTKEQGPFTLEAEAVITVVVDIMEEVVTEVVAVDMAEDATDIMVTVGITGITDGTEDGMATVSGHLSG